MKSNKIWSMALCGALFMSASNADAAKSYKRGVSENSFALQEEFDVLIPGVSWFYTWGNVPTSNIFDIPGEATMEFVPMCWNGNYNADEIRNWCRNHPETKYLLGFNEPNFTSQANMTPAEAAEAWPTVKALADELGLELVGPAVNYSPDGPENDPFTWYANFVNLVGLDAFDYIAIHCYAGGTGTMQNMIDTFYDTYGKKIWLTEFSMNGDRSATTTVDQQIASMVQQLEYLEKSDRVHRYAWFKAKGSATTSPCYGLIKPQNGYGERELSEQGMVYVYMTDFDETVYHGIDELVPASEYINSSSLMLGSTADAVNPGKLDITRFSGGAYADYQFDIPTAGEYTLTLRVSGQGYDQGRFDPTISIYSVDDNGEVLSTLCEAVQFDLSGENTSYETQPFTMTLQAGRQRIRIADGNAYQPSGIRMSCLSFNSALAGVEMVAASSGEVMKCTVNGDMICLQGAVDAATGSIYDMNGRLLMSSTVENGSMSIASLSRGFYLLKVVDREGKVKIAKFFR